MRETPREDWPSPSDLAEELAWAEYLRTYDEREARYAEWCRENSKDPEDTASAVEYEANYQQEQESR